MLPHLEYFLKGWYFSPYQRLLLRRDAAWLGSADWWTATTKTNPIGSHTATSCVTFFKPSTRRSLLLQSLLINGLMFTPPSWDPSLLVLGCRSSVSRVLIKQLKGNLCVKIKLHLSRSLCVYVCYSQIEWRHYHPTLNVCLSGHTEPL